MKCAWFQTKYNGGYNCIYGDRCHDVHEECASFEEYQALPKSWERAGAWNTPRGAGDWSARGGQGAGKGEWNAKGGKKGKAEPGKKPQKTAFANRANWDTFCKLGLDCPDKDKGCNKLHVAKEEAERHIAADKERRANSGAGMTPRQNQ